MATNHIESYKGHTWLNTRQASHTMHLANQSSKKLDNLSQSSHK